MLMLMMMMMSDSEMLLDCCFDYYSYSFRHYYCPAAEQ
jgi:hypothetical protein